MSVRQGGTLGFDREVPSLTLNHKRSLFEEQLKYQQLIGRNAGSNLRSNTVEEKDTKFLDFIEAQKHQGAIDYAKLSQDALARCNVIRKKSLNVLETRAKLCQAYKVPLE